MISIVIPAREEARDIEATVRQFAALTLPHEVIVSDGGSRDRTAEIARAAGARVVVGESGVRSPAKQRNDGAKAAQGDYLMFVDMTVRIPEIDAFVKKSLAHFDDERVAALTYIQWIYPEKATIADRFFLSLVNCFIYLSGVGSGKCMFVRRSAFEKIGGLREELMTGEDRDLFQRLKTQGEVRCDTALWIEYSGRREHAWGWPKLLWIWIRDTVAIHTVGRSMSKDWAPVHESTH